MASDYDTFWQLKRFAVVGDGKVKPFPKLTYRGLKRNGKVVYPVVKTAREIDGDRAYAELSELPEPVEAVVIEVPKTETLEWFKRAVDCGVKDIWLHMNTEVNEVFELSKQHGIRLRTGTCAVMYLAPGLSMHGVHRLVQRMRGKY